MKTVAIIIARMGSTRLPGKVLMDLAGYPVLEWAVTSAIAAPGVNDVVIATSTDPRDDKIFNWASKHGISCFRGSENDVLSRFYGAAKEAEADVLVRLTGDCPFIDPYVVGEVVALRAAIGADYVSNNDPPTWPDGLDCEAITFEALEEANAEATRPSDRDTVTQYLVRNRSRYKSGSLACPVPGLHKERWVLDTEDDYEFCQRLAELSHPGASYLRNLRALDDYPDLRKINAHHPRNERFFAAISTEPTKRSFTESSLRFSETIKTIPLGAQTFSKSYLQYPSEAPLFVTHGNGGLCYDVDGNDYVDLVGGLLPNLLGHRDPDVDFAIRQQLSAGISHSLSTPLELELASLLKKHIPCAEMVRFGKNGTDVTSAAVRLARAVTGRNKILTSGYHGWSDWSICDDRVRNAGVPDGVSRDTIRFDTTNTTLNAICDPAEVACVIIEPEVDPDFLKYLREWCTKYGAILIFDEIITGFRFGMAGAQGLYGVTPDLACFGKSMANGMPISALVGKREIMQDMERVCFSGTFFGETLSLAAAIATIKKLEREPILDHIRWLNQQALDIFELAITRHQLHYLHIISMLPTEYGLQRLSFADQDVKTLFMQEMIANGVLIIASHNWCYAHTDDDLKRLEIAYDNTFRKIAEAEKEGDYKKFIKGRVIGKEANIRSTAA